MERFKKIFVSLLLGSLYSSLIIGCGDRDASLALLPTSMNLQLEAEEPKKLQMLIVGDPTKSMIETQEALERSLPNFTSSLVSTGFVFDVFCTTNLYNGGQITSLRVENYRKPEGFDFQRLSQEIGECVNAQINDSNQESGLEAAKKAWEKVISSKLLDPSAVKLTMIVSNEDDCSVDPSKVNSDKEVACDQSAKPGTQIPMTLRGLADDERLYSTDRYVKFFDEYLTYEVKNDDTGLVRKRGHIFAPVIMKSPEDAGSVNAKACVDEKAVRAGQLYDKDTNIAAYVMSYGQRYFEVSQGLGSATYSLCENIANVLSTVHADIEKQVLDKTFYLKRRPKNPNDLTILVRRKIANPEKAVAVLSDMQKLSSSLPNDLAWKKDPKNKNVWERKLINGNGFTYISETNEIILDNKIYTPYNDSLKVLKYLPAGFDGEVKYGENQ